MTPRKLTRSRDDKWVAGVCGGLAEYTAIDATLIRLITAVAIILGAGSLIVIYLICWALIPKEPDVQPATPPATPPPSSSSQ
jgi:phage shock protein PspC (stress-responsive transcriptional regulator)